MSDRIAGLYSGKRNTGCIMAKFECNWCGKCCASFGEFIKIERQLTERDYYCRYGITNEIFFVHVKPEFAREVREAFEETGGHPPADGQKKGCIFMQKNPEGKGFACAIYETRPGICREFKCYRMLIHHMPGMELRGRVIGISELRTEDEVLAKIWKEKIAGLPHPVTGNGANNGHVKSPQIPGAGHNSHIRAHLKGTQHGGDEAWVSNVIAILAAHGYHGEPVE